jgi:malonyl CoA-acyl carrier protein transacylase
MLADLAAQYPIVEATFSEASSVLGYDLWQLVQQGPAEELNKTLANAAGIAGRLSGDFPRLAAAGRQNACHHGRPQPG